MRRALKIIGALIALGVVAAVVVWVFFTGPGPIPPATVDFAALSPAEHQALVDRGRYVAQAADCEACHISQDGLPYAGGLPMETPFGTLYGTNITTSATYGIAGWSADDLYRAMVYGIEPSGRHLYPAMPYTSYHYTSRADVDALWAYLMTRPAIEKPNRPAELMFPLNIRPAVAFWNVLYRPHDHALPPVEDKSATWERGRYLVDVLGHCGECHTPRNLLYARQTDKHLAGNVIEGTLAPDITTAGLVARGWTPDDLAQFLKAGLAPQGTMLFRMFSVLSHSTQHLSDEDIGAMVTYLMGEAPPAPVQVAAADHPDAAEGRAIYLGLCAGCHQPDGEGQPHASVPLRTNTSLRMDDPLNLILAIRNGIAVKDLPGNNRMQAMPAFGGRLTDAQMAALVNYLRATWGGQPGDVTPEQVSGKPAAG